MKMRLVDGTELAVQRLQCTYPNSFGVVVSDSIVIEEDEIKRVGVDAINAAITKENIATVVFTTSAGKEITKNYTGIQDKRYLLSDTLEIFNISFTNSESSEGATVDEG